MEAADRLLRMFLYDLWSNEQILQALQQNLDFVEADKAIQFFAHIAASQEMWYRRIKGQSLEGLEIWPDYDLPIAIQKLNTLSEKWQVLIDTNRDALDQTISYKNSKGTTYKTELSDILHHLIIHGQHHRAQIASMLRNAKINPPSTDFIFFTRAN